MKKIIYVLLILLLLVHISIVSGQSLGVGQSLHTLVINDQGEVYSWGRGNSGELGNESISNPKVPNKVEASGVLNSKTIIKIAYGNAHSMALSSEGRVYTWGNNWYGQLGNGNNSNSGTPVGVKTDGVLSGKSIIAIAAGHSHCLVLDSDGAIYAWGYNCDGQLGNDNTNNSNTPVAVNTNGVLSGKKIKAIACGGYYSIALDEEGKLYSWGMGHWGQLGDGTTIRRTLPISVKMDGALSGKTVIKIAAGEHHTMVLASDGNIYSWGLNNYGQLGYGNNLNNNSPTQINMNGVLLNKTIVSIVAGGWHSIALDNSGKAYTWGFNEKGQLGDGSNSHRYSAVAVDNSGVLLGENITKIGSGAGHTIAMSSDGNFYTWGNNENGQLGIGSNISSNIPVEVNNASLPVELIAFSGTPIDNKVNLSWETATEVNNYGFEIEKLILTPLSTNENKISNTNQIIPSGDEGWEVIEFVNGYGNSNSSKQYSYTDNNLNSGKIKYRLKQIDIDGSYEYSKEIEVNISVPTELNLGQNYPNPFNPSTTINYTIVKNGNVELKIYNSLGEEILELVNKNQNVGKYEINFDASEYSSGMYFYRLITQNKSKIKKMILIK